MLDPAIGDTYSRDEVLKCLKIGLLCVQEDLNCRPTMANIVNELSSQHVTLELPQQLPFFLGRTERSMEELETDQSTGRSMPLLINAMFDHGSSAPVNGDVSVIVSPTS
ncbi:hypothetical protein NL676_032813 [Syzygium grande]|nr:hypothetical protein NL676_032813 [Syzygium grande]